MCFLISSQNIGNVMFFIETKQSKNPQTTPILQDLNLQNDFEENRVYANFLWKWNGVEQPLFTV